MEAKLRMVQIKFRCSISWAFQVALVVTNLESVILSEVSQTEEKYHINSLHVESKMLQMKLHTKQKEFHRFRE